MQRPIASLSVALLIGVALPAQTSSLLFPASTAVRSVRVLDDGVLLVSEFSNAMQHIVDARDPAAPVVVHSFDPPFGDQWYEAEYTAAFGGRVVTGHRGGGLNLIDVSDPLGASPPAVLDSVATRYHYRGMRFFLDAATNRHYLGYSEHNTGNGGGGLRIYELTQTVIPGDTLTEVWNSGIVSGEDASGLAMFGQHLYQFWSTGNNQFSEELRVYDVTDPTLPTLVQTVPMPITTLGGKPELDAHPTGPVLLAARNFGGLVHLDVTDPVNPVATQVINAHPLIGIRMVSFLNSLVAIAAGSAGGVEFQLLLFVPPSGPPVVLTVLLPGTLAALDIVSDASGRVYMGGANTGVGELQVW